MNQIEDEHDLITWHLLELMMTRLRQWLAQCKLVAIGYWLLTCVCAPLKLPAIAEAPSNGIRIKSLKTSPSFNSSLMMTLEILASLSSSIALNFKKSSWMLQSSSRYRTHMDDCSTFPLSVVSSAMIVKKLDKFMLDTSFSWWYRNK
jgi:hypothetical protein